MDSSREEKGNYEVLGDGEDCTCKEMVRVGPSKIMLDPVLEEGEVVTKRNKP